MYAQFRIICGELNSNIDTLILVIGVVIEEVTREGEVSSSNFTSHVTRDFT